MASSSPPSPPPCVFFCCWAALVVVGIAVCSSPLAVRGEAPEPSPSPNATTHASHAGGPSPGPSPQSNAPGPSEISSSPSPSPSPSSFPSPSPDYSPSPEPSAADENRTPADSSNTSVTWCAVRDEYSDCQYFLSLLHKGTYEWSCVRKQSTAECMEAIKNKEADLINLDAGLAYIAFTNYSMKAVMAEEYCYHSKSYNAVVVVSKEMCDKNSNLKLEDFRGQRSCHPGYRTAAGWNYPVQYLVQKGLQKPFLGDDLQSDEAVVNSFFSETCAPSEIDGTGLCTSCGNNGSCDPSISDIYRGYAGAFRCLMEGLGDIAFLKPDTTVRLSSDGLNAQNWSTKSVNEFMYLCPEGGCRPINDNIRDCSFGSIPANVIMTHNSQSNTKRNAIVSTLMNASKWTDVLYTGHNWHDHVFSASTQGLVEVSELTRSYLGDSASVAQSVGALQATNMSSLDTNAACFSKSISSTIVFTSLFIAFLL